MTHILDNKTLAADDVLCVPAMGILPSRSDAKIAPFIYSAPMDTVTGYTLTKELVELGHFPVVSRALKRDEWLRTLREFAGHPQVFFAIGLDRNQLKNLIDTLIEMEIDKPINLAIDIAHGDMKQAHELAAYLSELGICRFIMSGSICTPSAAIRATMNGCTHLRVGVGPGSVCSTRLMTGCGYPQLSAIYQIAKLGPRAQIIADGGIRNSGDAVKYLAAGANGVMLGGLLSKTVEATGWEFVGWEQPPTDGTISFPMPSPEPIYQKNFRGQASASFMREHGKTHACPEGIEKTITWEGDKLKHTVKSFEAGIAGGISLLGLTSIEELGPETVEMVQVTNSAILEGKPQ